MNTYTFDRENRTIKVQKDCRKCTHLNVCIFHKNTEEFARKNPMYSMNQYAEHNNVLRVFEIHASCSHYVSKFKHVIGEAPNLESDSDIITTIIHNDVSLTEEKIMVEQYPEHKDNMFFFFQPDIKTDVKANTFSLSLKTTNKEIGHGTVVFEQAKTITEILDTWKFI